MRIVREDESGRRWWSLPLPWCFLLVPILIGSAEFARAAYAYIEVSNAARAAVAYGAQTHATALDTAGCSPPPETTMRSIPRD